MPEIEHAKDDARDQPDAVALRTSEPAPPLHATDQTDLKPSADLRDQDGHPGGPARDEAVHDDDGGDSMWRRFVGSTPFLIFVALAVAILVKTFVIQAFYIPSESMEPTLYENDRILVNKLSYKLHDVNRGDLVVFEKPANEPASGIKDLIKRTIALPNETIELQADGRILIDGRELSEPYLAEGQQPGQMTMARGNFVDGACTNPPEETTRCTIGEGFVWVMGDNRDHSHDSRAFGPINEDLIVGRAFVKVWPLSEIGFL
jgi:signal peptidase I